MVMKGTEPSSPRCYAFGLSTGESHSLECKRKTKKEYESVYIWRMNWLELGMKNNFFNIIMQEQYEKSMKDDCKLRLVKLEIL